MHLISRLCAALLVCVAASATVAAQGTGSISGAVFDSTGAIVEGARVTVTSDQMPAGRSYTTTHTGMFNFQALLPGVYTVTVDKQGVGTSTRTIAVEVGKDTQGTSRSALP